KHESAKISRRKIIFLRVERAIALERYFFPRGSVPPLRNRKIPRADAFHRSGIAEFHAREEPTAGAWGNCTRGGGPAPGVGGVARAGAVRRAGLAESHAEESAHAR